LLIRLIITLLTIGRHQLGTLNLINQHILSTHLMMRLNQKGFEILKAEIEKCAGNDLAGQVQREIALKRLEKLREQPGTPATVEELRDLVVDLFPTFSEKVLQQVVRANQPAGPWGLAKVAVLSIVGLVGGLYILNLPYPMIRRPVSNVAPILLLPSFISMDYNYRQTVSLVEQADQLVNQATSPEDITLGEQKVKQAAKHLDALPVWFLDYSPRYAGFWRGYQFTLDEFRQARQNIGRMEAKIFQEKNAQTQLDKGEQALSAAKQQYQQAKTTADQRQAIGSWQAAIDLLDQIPNPTLAGRLAATKVLAYKRDLEQIAGATVTNARSGNLIDAAKLFGKSAADSAQNPPHSVDEWTEIGNLWMQAIDRLKDIPVDDSGYAEAQVLLVEYQKNLGTVRIRLKAEQESAEALAQAKEKINNLLAASTPTSDRGQVNAQVQRIINDLEKVQKGTTGYTEAQTLLQNARKKFKQLS